MLLCELLNINLGNVRNHNYDPIKILELHNSKSNIKKFKTKIVIAHGNVFRE